ncbi:MAG TPA: outer membrane protein assembly factor BamA [Gammaproteobacteria bacterium]|nr:outer membrane protein assembly factor BamA [Gammaproteobacteria bacterium]
MRRLLVLFILLFVQPTLRASENFVIDDIRLQGLERIPEGTLLNYLPLKVGDQFDVNQSTYVIQELYKTGFFKDVKLLKDGNVLVVEVLERPAISEITWSGNKDIEDEQLKEILSDIGIVKGRVFNPSALDKIEQGLKQQAYFSRGKYAVRIKTEVKALERNRVDINIDISEGEVAKIKQVNIVGNTIFDDDVLLPELQLGVPGTWDFFSSMDDYAKPKLAADEETIKSYYQDRGFIKFAVDSTQVSITPDKKDIYITMNVTEGDKYRVNSIKLAGDLKLEEKELRSLISLKKGDVFSRGKMVDSKDLLKRRLGNEGYAFANVKVMPELDDEHLEVNLTYFIEPGKKVYVRRINFIGNYKTNDSVLRREMRLMEGGELSNSKLQRSKIRLQRLPYVEEVVVNKDPVPGTQDLIDINVSIKERLSGSFNIGAGFSQNQGLVFNLGVTMDNLNGSGEKLSLNFNNDQANTIYNASFTDPYYTIDGISRTLAFSFRERNTARLNVFNYLQNTAAANLFYGIPLSEFNRVRVGVGLDRTEIIPATNSATVTPDVTRFLEENKDGRVNSVTMVASFTHDTRNRTVFATSGSSQSVILDFTAPGSDLEYYKLTYRNKFYFQITNSLTSLIRMNLAYGNAYGDTQLYPFYKRSFAGGLRTVRGYDSNSLGPRPENTNGGLNNPIGGDILTVASAELIFPVPFMEKSPSSVRLSVFYDIGNVFLNNELAQDGGPYNPASGEDPLTGTGGFDAAELRSSVGVSFVWLAPVGPLKFSFARPLNDQPGDRIQAFQFSIGQFF